MEIDRQSAGLEAPYSVFEAIRCSGYTNMLQLVFFFSLRDDHRNV